MRNVQVSQLMEMGREDNGDAASKLKSLEGQISGVVGLSGVRASELRRAYEQRLQLTLARGYPTVIDLDIFVERLRDLTGFVTVFSVEHGDWAFIGFLEPSGHDKWRAVTAVQRRSKAVE